MLLICIFFMPETLFDRPLERQKASNDNDPGGDVLCTDSKPEIVETEEISPREPYMTPRMTLQTYLNRLWLWDLQRPTSRQIHASDFVLKPLSMLKYPSVAFPALY